jgi:hypothetical protein
MEFSTRKKLPYFLLCKKTLGLSKTHQLILTKNRKCHFCSYGAKLQKAMFLKLLIYSYILTITKLLNLLYSIQAVKDISKDFPSFAEMNNCVVNPAEWAWLKTAIQ